MYILASQSPRRVELLKNIVSDFKVIPANIDENIKYNDASDLPLKLSFMKAVEVFKDHKDDTIIAADTIVIIDNKVLGKPRNKKEASQMLHMLSGKEHKVITGYTIISKSRYVSKKIATKVYFNELSDELINEYIETGSPLDKAGAYGIQDKEFPLIKKIEGSLSNVMGLPVESLQNELI